MGVINTLRLLTLCVMGAVSTPDPQEYFPLPYPGRPHPHPQDSQFSHSQPWPQSIRRNFTAPRPSFPDPVAPPSIDQIFTNDIPRQTYGIPLPPTSSSSSFPQIYKLDNLIIIANPVQPQPCIPQPRPPPNFPNPNGGGSGGDGLDNRFGEEPSKCTWAIVACCSPENTNVRYNCFELLGCPGFFFDNSPCDPKTVEAAAKAALEFYRSNGTNGSGNNGTDTNQLRK